LKTLPGSLSFSPPSAASHVWYSHPVIANAHHRRSVHTTCIISAEAFLEQKRERKCCQQQEFPATLGFGAEKFAPRQPSPPPPLSTEPNADRSEIGSNADDSSSQGSDIDVDAVLQRMEKKGTKAKFHKQLPMILLFLLCLLSPPPRCRSARPHSSMDVQLSFFTSSSRTRIRKEKNGAK